MAPNAKRNQQRLGVTAAAMVDNQLPGGAAGPAMLLIAGKDQIAQAAEPAPRMVIALIAKPAAAEAVQLNAAAAARAQQPQLRTPCLGL